MFHFPVFQLVLNQEPRGEMGRCESGAGPSPCNSHKLSPWPLGDRMAVDLKRSYISGTSLVAQWLRLDAPNIEDPTCCN